MTRTWKITKAFLLIWGAITFLIFLVKAGCFLYSFRSDNIFDITPSNHAKSSKEDVGFVLNGCGLGDDRTKSVLHSYTSERSFGNDHLDGHAILVTHLDESDFQIFDDSNDKWYRGDKLTGTAKEAVGYASMWVEGDEMSWFPNMSELQSSETYVYISSVGFHGINPDSAQLIFAQPNKNMVYYFSASH